jgi:hypothetical protein
MSRTFAFASSSFEYTHGALPLARKLEEHGYTVHWISFRGHERHWLLKQGVSPAHILDTLATFDPRRHTGDNLIRSLKRLENGSPPYVNDIILMDRLLRRKPDQFGYAYLAHLDEVVSDYLVRNDIRFVSNGRDTALQVACAKICARLGIISVVPTGIRLPDHRYGFCPGHTEEEFVQFRIAGEPERSQAREFLKLFRETKPIPHYVLLERRNNRFLRRIPKDVRLYGAHFLRGLRDLSNDYTRYSLARLFAMYLRRRLNALHLSMAPPFEPVGTQPFVIYAYHVQPESSVDVLASYVSDQPALIRQIARALPASHELYVKPHQDHLGGLSRRELVTLKKIPGVRLVSPYLQSHELMLRSSAILTLTGTMAFQGALHGVPSIIFAPQFFKSLPGVHYCTSPVELPTLFARVLSRPKVDDDAQLVDFLAQQIANSFIGRYVPYMSAFSESEVTGLVDAYDTAYRALVEPVGLSAAAPRGTLAGM